MGSTIVITIDSREKVPLPFPRHLSVPLTSTTNRMVPVHTMTAAMPEGDYGLQGFHDLCLIERKKDLGEVLTNVGSTDSTRFIHALDRLAAACRYPVLFLEGDPVQLESVLARGDGRPYGESFMALSRLLMERRISLLLCRTQSPAQRRAAGSLIARTLLAQVYPSPLSFPPDEVRGNGASLDAVPSSH